jgi:LCP family protein required for cell wall assembly
VENKPARWRKSLLAISLVVTLLGGALFWVTNHYSNKIPRSVDLSQLTDRPLDTPGTTFLLVGSDDRSGLSRKQRAQLKLGKLDYGRHTDTMILIHISEQDGQVAMVSIPRDSYVQIPPWQDEQGKKFNSETNRINVAYGRGGPALAVNTVEQATGLKIDHYLEIDFAGFTNIVEALGGVEICVDKPLKDSPSGLDIEAGKSTLNPAQSLAFVRARQLDANSDIGRVERQRTFVLAMGKKIFSKEMLTDPGSFNRVVDAIARSVKADTGLSLSQLISIGSSLRKVQLNKVDMTTVPLDNTSFTAPGVGSVVLWNERKANNLFEKIAQDLPAKTPVAAASTDLLPTEVQVNVFNASGLKGLATTAVDDLVRAGFVVPDPAANWGVSGAKVSVVRHSPDQLAAAQLLAELFPGTRVEKADELGSRIDLLVGENWGRPNLPISGVSQGLCD